MRALRPPRPVTIRIAGVAEITAGAILVLAWATNREVLGLVLAAALIVSGITTVWAARAGQHGDTPGTAADDEDDEEDWRRRTVSLDRSTMPDEAQDDNRAEIDPALVPTLEALVTWLDEHDYLPVDRSAPRASWTLRLRGRRAAVLEVSGEVHYLLPADTALHAGSHLTAQYRARG
ncbi:hypothetical protein SAMN05443377_10753 [Propionibacterium cyclohexanicum]|uniref:Uncharacterized protein n=1 Tax=Propionibacterium cyclohexanicum TaxID=64702 RepID=A0A1H9RIS2_9ACTN|nr:hypothetical protein [Propionibacterium cyclohexanicum]SER71829.1 hypothetical protein SAMN05443377_10753 [Propionibacterium cyclohexanicum]